MYRGHNRGAERRYRRARSKLKPVLPLEPIARSWALVRTPNRDAANRNGGRSRTGRRTGRRMRPASGRCECTPGSSGHEQQNENFLAASLMLRYFATRKRVALTNNGLGCPSTQFRRDFDIEPALYVVRLELLGLGLAHFVACC